MSRMVMVWVLLFGALGMAQEPTSTSKEPPIPPQNQEDEAIRSVGGQSFVDDVFQSLQNHWGFSLSAYQAYTTDISNGSEQAQGSGITSFSPNTFLNLGRRRSRFHVDVGAGYRRYNHPGALNSWDYFGNARYTYEFSRHTSFQLSNQFTSSFNDSWSFVSLSSPIEQNSNFSNEILFNRQRITRNSLTAELNSQVSRKVRIGVFGGYRLYRYPQTNLMNADAFEVGGTFDYRLTSWLNLTNRYSTYLNHVDEQSDNGRIHRLQVGNLDFHLSRSWRLWMGGGAEIIDRHDDMRVGESANAGIEYTSLRSTISVTYDHGFTSGIGISRLLRSDVVSAEFGFRATNWLSANLQSYYYRNHELDSDGRLETLSWGGGVQFALRRDLILTGNSFYQKQKTRSFSIEGLGLDRVTTYLGLQYMWPSLTR
jgi:hypothetical protein